MIAWSFLVFGLGAVEPSSHGTLQVGAGQPVIVRLQGHEGRVNDVAFVLGDRSALTVSDDKTVRLWDLTSGEEQAAFTRARGMMPTRLHGTIEGTWSEIWNGDFSGAQGVLGGVADSHETWIARIHELRTIYGTLQTPQDQWAVSTGPGAPRNPTNEPDMDTLYALYAQTDDSVGFNFTMPERRQIADGWRARWRRY